GIASLHTQTPGKFLHVIASLHPRTPAHLLHVIARSGAAAPRRGNPLLLAVGQNEKQYFRRIRKALRICPGDAFLQTLTPARLQHVIARSEATWQSVLLAAAHNEK